MLRRYGDAGLVSSSCDGPARGGRVTGCTRSTIRSPGRSVFIASTHDTHSGAREQANNVSRPLVCCPTPDPDSRHQRIISAWHPAAPSTIRARPRPRWSSTIRRNSMASLPYELRPASPNRSSSFNTCTSLTYVLSRLLVAPACRALGPIDGLPPHPTPKRQDWLRPAPVPNAHVGHAPAPNAAAWACVRAAPTHHPWASWPLRPPPPAASLRALRSRPIRADVSSGARVRHCPARAPPAPRCRPRSPSPLRPS